MSALRDGNLALTNTFSRTVSSQKQLWMGKLLRSISQRIKTTRIWANQNFWDFFDFTNNNRTQSAKIGYIFRITLRMKQEKQYLTDAKHTTTFACSANRNWSEASVGSVLRRTNENYSQGNDEWKRKCVGFSFFHLYFEWLIILIIFNNILNEVHNYELSIDRFDQYPIHSNYSVTHVWLFTILNMISSMQKIETIDFHIHS